MHKTPKMLKNMWLLLACFVPATGQAATKDTTQWRCRNRKLSCKKWAVDNQCTANYPFMAEGVAPHPRTHGTRHAQRRAACDTLQRTIQPCIVASCVSCTLVSAECPAACDLCTNAGLAATPALRATEELQTASPLTRACQSPNAAKHPYKSGQTTGPPCCTCW